MSYTFRPAVREDTPIIAGLAGPTKSGKTYSALRLATGMAKGGRIAMINAEGKRGHQYADKFHYDAVDIGPPYSPEKYTEVMKAALELRPGAIIIDSMSHMHDGPGGLLEMHDDELDRMVGKDGTDYKKRQRMTWAAWIKPKKLENQFVYTMLLAECPVVLCFRAKEKLKIVQGKEPIDLGWQPIASDRVSFETLFTLMLEPHSKGIPTRDLSEMREPFDTMVNFDSPVDESLGGKLTEWAKGRAVERAAAIAKINEVGDRATATSAAGSDAAPLVTTAQAEELHKMCVDQDVPTGKLVAAVGVESLKQMRSADYDRAKQWVNRYVDARIAAREART